MTSWITFGLKYLDQISTGIGTAYYDPTPQLQPVVYALSITTLTLMFYIHVQATGILRIPQSQHHGL